ncbi:MAG: hypothetical protein UD936_10925 [Acutalibacteraceae bacterium]|nr:hypothetical protein [Acutalibacteraceae bacterium]
MRKKIFTSIILVASVVLVTVLVYQLTYDRESAIIEYLENRYNQKFTVISKSETTNDDYKYAYNVSSESNNNVIFTAGQKKSQHIFPFIPPVKDKVFFDDYFEQSKSYVVSEALEQNTFNLENEKNINLLVDEIYTYMEEINLSLSEMGFATTKYTCSIEAFVSVDNRVEEVSFYILDKSAIYNQLQQLCR